MYKNNHNSYINYIKLNTNTTLGTNLQHFSQNGTQGLLFLQEEVVSEFRGRRVGEGGLLGHDATHIFPEAQVHSGEEFTRHNGVTKKELHIHEMFSNSLCA